MASRLTKAERKWLDELQAVLDRCPSKRMGAYCGGDPDIFLYDKKKYEKCRNKNIGDVEEIELHEDAEDDLGTIRFPFNVDAVRL